MKYFVGLVIVAVVGFAIWWKLTPDDEERGLKPARVEDVRRMVELSTVEIREDLPIKGRVGKRHLVAMQRLEGSIGYDLERISLSERGDTLVVTLPPAEITLRESTDEGSYVVIDEWSDDFFGSGKLTAREANILKEKCIALEKERLRRAGYVERARRQAVADLERLLPLLTGRVVEISD